MPDESHGISYKNSQICHSAMYIRIICIERSQTLVRVTISMKNREVGLSTESRLGLLPQLGEYFVGQWTAVTASALLQKCCNLFLKLTS